MVKQLETELPSRTRRARPWRSAGHQLLVHGETVLVDGVEVKLSPAPVRGAPEPGGQPRHTSSHAATCWRRCPRAPRAPSTPSRWRSRGCAPRSAPGPCRPWSSAATGWRSTHEARDRGTRHPARLRQRGRPRADRCGRRAARPARHGVVRRALRAVASTSVLAASDEPTVVVPLLLSTGHHLRHDLPASLAAARGPVVLGPSLGPHPLLAAAQVERLLRGGRGARRAGRHGRGRVARPARGPRPGAAPAATSPSCGADRSRRRDARSDRACGPATWSRPGCAVSPYLLAPTATSPTGCADAARPRAPWSRRDRAAPRRGGARWSAGDLGGGVPGDQGSVELLGRDPGAEVPESPDLRGPRPAEASPHRKSMSSMSVSPPSDA